jgi:glucosamine--fructose-6-phosphate aminotransferase (isomerizing)
VPDAVRGALAAPGTEQVPIPRRSLQIIGSGHASVTAKEGALKVREGARVLAEGHDAEFFLHGTAVPLTSDDHLLAIMSGDDDGLVDGLSTAAAGAGLGVTRLLETSGLPSVLAQIPLTVRLQLLASRFADERGQNPDTVIVPPWDDAGLWSIGSPLA